MENQSWDYCTFQIHWNKLEWLNPRNHIEQKKSICVSSKKCLKDNDKTAHWFGHLKLKPLNTIDFLQ